MMTWTKLVVALSLAGATACGSATDDAGDIGGGASNSAERPPDPDIGSMKQSLSGFPFSDAEYSGLVRIWTYNFTAQEWRHWCSGVLWRNDVVVTAKHCLLTPADAIAAGWPDHTSNTGLLLVTTSSVASYAWGTGPARVLDERDLGAFRVNASLPVRSGGQVRWSGYRRPSGAPNGNTDFAFVYGYGLTSADQSSTICNYKSPNGTPRPGCFNDPLWPHFYFGTPLTTSVGTGIVQDVQSFGGDSGGLVALVRDVADPADEPMLGVNTISRECINLNRCGSAFARADTIAGWLDSI
jgi:hypothetical protein